MEARVYSYGLLRPTVNGDVAREIVRAAHEHRKELVEIERERRADVRALIDKSGDVDALKRKVETAKQAREEAVSSLKRTRSLTRSRSETAVQTEVVRIARTFEKTAVTALRVARAAQQSDEFKSAREAVDEAVLARTNEKYRQSKLKEFDAWGTRALLNDAMLGVRKMPLFDEAEPNDPSFPRWRREGNLGVAVHQKGVGGNGLTIDEVHDGIPGGWLQIERLKETAASKRALRHTVLRMRVGTDLDGKPIIIEWPMIMHRPLPDGAIVRYADVTLRKIGPREEWQVKITFTCDGLSRERCGSGTVAVNIGWHTVPGGLRVATWIDEASNAGELVLSDTEPVRPEGRERNRRSNAGPLASLLRSRELESTRTRNMTTALNELAAWLRVVGMPKWMAALTVRRGERVPSQAQALAYLASWESEARLAGLCLRWKNNRFDGDVKGFEALETWRYHDYHMWRWEASQRKGAVRRRQDIYRCFAAQLSRRYERVVVPGANYADLAKKSKPEGKPRIAPADALRQAAAPGELRNVVEQGFVARGGLVSRVGKKEPKKLPKYVQWLTADELSMTCPACGAGAECSEDHNTVCLSCTYTRDTSTTWCLNALRAAGFGPSVDAMIKRGRQIAGTLARGPVMARNREVLAGREKRAVTRGSKRTEHEDVSGAAE